MLRLARECLKPFAGSLSGAMVNISVLKPIHLQTTEVPEIWDCGVGYLRVWFGKGSSRGRNAESVPTSTLLTVVSANLISKTDVTFHRMPEKISVKA